MGQATEAKIKGLFIALKFKCYFLEMFFLKIYFQKLLNLKVSKIPKS